MAESRLMEPLLHAGQRLGPAERVGRGAGDSETQTFVQRLVALFRGADAERELRVATAYGLRFDPHHHARGQTATTIVRVYRDVLHVEVRVAIRPHDRAHQHLTQPRQYTPAVAQPVLDVGHLCSPDTWGRILNAQILFECGTLQRPHLCSVGRCCALEAQRLVWNHLASYTCMAT